MGGKSRAKLHAFDGLPGKHQKPGVSIEAGHVASGPDQARSDSGIAHSELEHGSSLLTAPHIKIDVARMPAMQKRIELRIALALRRHRTGRCAFASCHGCE